MPKGLNLKNFGRRKSSGNALDVEQEAPAASNQSSFRVLERPDKKSVTYGSRDGTVNRPFASPLNALRGKSADDLGLAPNRSIDSSRNRPGWPLSGARGSGGTTNSGSSGYYESSSASARHSSTSTLPSSLDQDHNEEELFPPKRAQTAGMYQTVAANADELLPPPPPSSFTTRAARALSFGNKNGRNSKDLPQDVPPLPPPHAAANGVPVNPARSHSPFRERAMTTSSYASTAVPAKTELTLNGDFGRDDDFSNMFEDLKKDSPLPPPPAVGSFHRTESEPMFPPRTLSRNALSSSPNPMKISREDTESPYSWDERSSNEGLVLSPALSSPNTLDGNAPGPAVGNGITQAFLGNSKSGYSRVPERYNSPGPQRTASVDSYSSVTDDGREKEPEYPNRQTHVADNDRWVRRVELRDPQGPNLVSSPEPTKATLSTTRSTLNSTPASRPGAVSPNSSTGDSFAADSNTTTPRAARVDFKGKGRADNSMFDSSPVGPPSRAIRPPAHQRTESSGMKKMTKAQFQALKRHEQGSAEQSEEEDLSGDDYDDDDDIARAKNMAKQRQKQEANMSVYRQQMKKVTGGGPTDLPSSSASTVRPPMDRGSSAPPTTGGGLHFGGIGGTPPAETIKGKDDDGDDDDVPLGILQAHGFPSGSRPPTRQDANDMAHQRRTSVAGSVVNGGAGQGNLPPFARRLPADPYFGAGLVNHTTRESLAMNSSGMSVVGMPTGPMPPQMQQPGNGHPGGLVGIIAGEERAKAARRGSPNPITGMYNSMSSTALPSNIGMPPMPRTMSMGNLPPPSMYGAPPVPPMPQMGMGMGMGQMGMMPQMPLDPGQQQMQQFMQMQMQLMQNMLSMQQAQMGQQGAQTPQPMQPQQQAGDYLGVNFNNMQRPMSVASQQSQLQPPAANQGRAMTMMNPPSGWNQAPPQPGAPRPTSAMPLSNGGYAPSLSGLNISGGGPGPGYTPSIAPSERSNVGMPSRYRPVTQNGETSRTQSMTSSLTLQAFQKQQTSPNLPGTPFNASQVQTPKSTIRIVDKPKGAPKLQSRPVDEDEDDGWAEMRKKREDKKKFKWGSKSKSQSQKEPALSDLYQGLE